MDTGFHQPFKSNQQISEVAFVHVRTNRIVVDTVLGAHNRALESSIKLARRKLDGKPLTARDAPQVPTAASPSEQIEHAALELTI